MLRRFENDRTQTVLMDMDDPVFRVGLKKLIQCAAVPHAPRNQAGQVIDLPAKMLYFIIVICLFLSVRQEVKLYTRAVHVAVIIHQHGFEPTAPHIGHNLQYTYRFIHKTRPPKYRRLSYRAGS